VTRTLTPSEYRAEVAGRTPDGFRYLSAEAEGGAVPVYITLVKWTDQGRAKASGLPDRVAEVERRIEAAGGRQIGNWLTMGRFDQVAVIEAPDDETAAKLLMVVAERGNAVTETLRGFTMEEVRRLVE
jgi:uncharacterized protein with GYD domain